MTSIQERALKLLGTGTISAAQVAAALGVTESAVSQMLSEPEFAAKVSELRYEALQKHNDRDDKIDALEDEVLSKLKESLSLVYRPMELTRIFQTLNTAKRRGQASPDNSIQHQKIVNLVMPVQIINKFSKTPNNMVLTAGTQELLTMQSGSLLDLHKNRVERLVENDDVDEGRARSVETFTGTGS